MGNNNSEEKIGGSSRGGKPKWSEEDACIVIENAFGQDFQKRILSPDQAGYNDYIEKLKTYVKKHITCITSSQLRNVYALVKGKNNPETLPYVRPKLAYVAGRANLDELRTLIYLLDLLILQVGDDKVKLLRFKDFIESVIAFHKYYGGKENA